MAEIVQFTSVITSTHTSDMISRPRSAIFAEFAYKSLKKLKLKKAKNFKKVATKMRIIFDLNLEIVRS